MKNTNRENMEFLESALSRLEKNENKIYFLTYDTKNNPRASIKYIYDAALSLKESGFNSVILVEDKTYGGVNWLGDVYNEIPVMTIKDDKVLINIDDVIVVPEQYSNVLPQLSNIKCIKFILLQQKEYMFESLAIGSRWSDFGFTKCITTTESSKKYVSEIFPESIVFVIPPFIDDIFKKSDTPIKPHVAISCRDRVQHRKIISEFYIKYPQLRWITFRDMVQMSYAEFADSLKECMVSVWVDDDSTFGTFPLESMKSNVPVIGKIPNNQPEWMGENGFWTYDVNKISELLGDFVLSWVEGVELSDEVKEKMISTTIPYTKDNFFKNIISVFNSAIEQRIETIKTTIIKANEDEKDNDNIADS